MQSEKLMCVTVVTDDETGIWRGGEVEYQVYLERLEQFLEAHGQKGTDAIKRTLLELAAFVERRKA